MQAHTYRQVCEHRHIQTSGCTRRHTWMHSGTCTRVHSYMTCIFTHAGAHRRARSLGPLLTPRLTEPGLVSPLWFLLCGSLHLKLRWSGQVGRCCRNGQAQNSMGVSCPCCVSVGGALRGGLAEGCAFPSMPVAGQRKRAWWSHTGCLQLCWTETPCATSAPTSLARASPWARLRPWQVRMDESPEVLGGQPQAPDACHLRVSQVWLQHPLLQEVFLSTPAQVPVVKDQVAGTG